MYCTITNAISYTWRIVLMGSIGGCIRIFYLSPDLPLVFLTWCHPVKCIIGQPPGCYNCNPQIETHWHDYFMLQICMRNMEAISIFSSIDSAHHIIADSYLANCMSTTDTQAFFSASLFDVGDGILYQNQTCCFKGQGVLARSWQFLACDSFLLLTVSCFWQFH